MFRPRALIAIAAGPLAAFVVACTGSCAGGSAERADGTATVTDPVPLADSATAEGAVEGSAEGSSGELAKADAVVEEPFVCELGVPDGSGGCIVTPADRRAALGEDGRWEYLLGHCPDDSYGSFADTWSWEPHGAEADIAALDLDGAATSFDLLSDFEGTSIILRVRDASTREKLAVIKTTSSNTRVEAEVYAHRLSVFLGFEELVPDVHHVPLTGGAIDKVEDLLRGVRYDDENKEARRQRVLRHLARAEDAGVPFMGAMKPWLSAFMFHSGLGHRESLAESDVIRTLRSRRAQPTDEPVRLRQYTRLYEPLGTHQGMIVMWQLAEDLSNIMLLDALTGQNDRFPGGNVHFAAVSGEEVEIGERRGRPIFDMGEVRLLALDNGAALHDRIGSGIRDLRGDIVSGTRVERFERESVERLEALGRRLLGRGCQTMPFDDEVDAIWTYLGLADDDDRELALGYLGRVFEYLDELREDDEIYLVPQLTPPSGSGSGDGSGAVGEGAVLSIDGEEPLPDALDAAVAAEPSEHPRNP